MGTKKAAPGPPQCDHMATGDHMDCLTQKTWAEI